MENQVFLKNKAHIKYILVITKMNNILKDFSSNFSSSIVVLLVAIPLCLGIALASGAPLFAGIIAGVVGGIVVGSLSGSSLSVSGPAAGLTVIVSLGIINLVSYETFLLAVVLAGVFQLILGYLKAGALGDYVPNSVIKGMLAAIGVILILKQIPHLVGFDADFEGDESFWQADSENTFSEILKAFNYFNFGAVLIGFISLGILILWETKFFKSKGFLKQIPSPLIVVFVGILINEWLLGSGSALALQSEHLVTLPIATNINQFLSFFTFPQFTQITNPQVWIVALTLAIVASLETLLSVEAIDKLDPLNRVTPTNRELKAQGVGNIVSGMLGGLPVTSVIVRSSANLNAGAKSKLSAILHGIFMLVCVTLIPWLLNKIPLSALAAILVFTGYKLAKITLFKEFWQKGYDQFVPFVVTILAILFTDLLEGILIGIGVGLFFMIRSNFKSSVFIINDGNQYLMRLRKDVSFLNKSTIRRSLERIPENTFLLIDATQADFVDQDVVDTINEFTHHAHLKNIKVELKKNSGNKMHAYFTENIS
jgi:MFS superfamily sulfate permease-like transporter